MRDLHLQHNVTPKQVEGIVLRLGQICLVTDVKILSTPRSALQTRKPMLWHNDAPAASIIAWFCMAEGHPNEFLRLIHIDQILSAFAESELKKLKGIACRTPKQYKPHESILRSYSDFPLLREGSDGKLLLNFTPWLDFPDISSIQISLVDRLKTVIDKESRNAQDVHLKTGDLITIRNGRFIHNRSSLSPSSQRHHRRYLISTLNEIGEQGGGLNALPSVSHF